MGILWYQVFLLVTCMCGVHVFVFSCVWLFVKPWTPACQTPLSMGFSLQKYWSGLTFSSHGNLPDLGIEPVSPAAPALTGRFFTTEPPVKPISDMKHMQITSIQTWYISQFLKIYKQSFIILSIKSEVAQLCPALCDPMGCSLAASSIHGIFQASILERVAISFSRSSSLPRDWTQVSHIVGRSFTLWATREDLKGRSPGKIFYPLKYCIFLLDLFLILLSIPTVIKAIF